MSAARSGLAWDGTAAAVAAVAALPAGLLALADVHAGAAVAVGVLPAAITGVAPRRRRRVRAALVAALIGACMVVGGVLAAVPVVAVAAIAGLGVGTAWLAARSRLGVLAMTLALPMVGIGLSFDAGEAAGAAALILAGGLWAWLVSLAWPERPPPARPGTAAGGAAPTLAYGVRLGAAGATAAAGTHPSRWYVTPAFTTFLVFLIFLSADPDTAGARFDERVGETVLGVAIAAVFGMAGSRRERPG